MQNAAEKKQFACIVVGGGAFGLAAISAMADLGITKSILLEKKKQLGSALQKSGESILLSGKAFTGEGLLKQFHTLLKIYAVQSAVGKEVLSFTYRDGSSERKERLLIPCRSNPIDPRSSGSRRKNRSADWRKASLSKKQIPFLNGTPLIFHFP